MFETYGGRVNTDWCWKDGKIVERHSVPDQWTTDYGAGLGWFNNDDDWAYSACTADMSSCLTRREQEHACCYLSLPLRKTTHHCIGTRICAHACGENGAFHSRNIIHGYCPT